MLYGIQAVTIRLRPIGLPAKRANQHRVHVLRNRISHVVFPVTKSPRRGVPTGRERVHARVRKRLARLPGIVLTVAVRVRPVKASVPRTVARDADILERLLVRERIHRHIHATAAQRLRQVCIHVILRIVRMPRKCELRHVVAFVETVVGIRRLVRDVDEVGKPEILNLPRAVPVPRVVPFPVKSILRFPKVKILRHKSGIHINGRRLVVARNIERIVVHDIVEIHADAEAVRERDQLKQFRLRSIKRTHGSPLILRSKIKAVPQIITYAEATRALARRR